MRRPDRRFSPSIDGAALPRLVLPGSVLNGTAPAATLRNQEPIDDRIGPVLCPPPASVGG